MLRVIAGKYKHRKLYQPPLEISRCTKDMVKEAMFSSIGENITNSSFLDLYGGSGAIGIEAYSRGASIVVINELNKDAFNIILSNLKSLDIQDIKVFNKYDTDCLKLLSEKEYKFDYIFLDPPYIIKIDYFYINSLQKLNILKENYSIIIESNTMLEDKLFDNFLVKQYKYGKTYLFVLKEKVTLWI